MDLNNGNQLFPWAIVFIKKQQKSIENSFHRLLFIRSGFRKQFICKNQSKFTVLLFYISFSYAIIKIVFLC